MVFCCYILPVEFLSEVEVLYTDYVRPKIDVSVTRISETVDMELFIAISIEI